MEQLYYLNHERFEPGDTKKAFEFAIQLIKKNKDVDTITFLVYQQHQYEPFLGEMGFTRQQIQAHMFNVNGIKIQIHTVKTYHPNYIFSGEPNRELLIAVGVPPKSLEEFIDKSRVKYWIIVPWIMDENEQFLKIFEAKNFETNEQITFEYEIDTRIKGAIEWLKATSYPNEGYHHPNDENRLKDMANAIKNYHIPFEHDALIHYCIHNGLLYDSACKTVEYFEKAQNRKFHVDSPYNPKFLLEQMNRTDWEIQNQL